LGRESKGGARNSAAVERSECGARCACDAAISELTMEEQGTDKDFAKQADRAHAPAPPRAAPPLSRRARFFGGPYWLILKNVLGWPLIAASLVAGPLVPGPGGIPLLLIGFALVSFPGKRRLTARALRGRPVRFTPFPFAMISLAVALALPAIVLAVAPARLRGWMARGPAAVGALYVTGVAVVWLLARVSPHTLNFMLRLMARTRRRVRPWLRRHGIRLLPPRWRRRHAHEHGAGPLKVTEEILKFLKHK